MIKKRNYIIILLLVLLASCDEKSLGDGYGLCESYDWSESERYITCEAERCISYIDSNKIDTIVFAYGSVIIIGGDILDYAFDSTFIVIEQRQEKNAIIQYWIVNKKEKCIFDRTKCEFSNVYGPFNKKEYLQERENLKIAKDLQLREEKLWWNKWLENIGNDILLCLSVVICLPLIVLVFFVVGLFILYVFGKFT
jgi:hypothetical protein